MSVNATNQRLFLSYARADDEPFVEKLCHDLRRLNFDPWYDRENMTNDGAPFTQAIGDAIRGSARLLLVVGPRSVASPYCRGEWQKALAECVPVLPLLRLGEYDSIPAEIGKGHAIDCRSTRDYGQCFNEIVRILRDPVRPLTSIGATPKLPPAYLVRPQYLEPLKQAIHSGDPLIAVTSKQETAALVGIGGIGKTTLAAALCHDCEVRRTFDQIHWINAGTTARTEDDAAALIWALMGGAPPGERGLNAARVAFARELHGKKTLLVVDDVWDVSVAQAFQFGGVDARTVITTRQRRIAEALGARSQAVDKLDEAEALALLSGRAGRELDADAAREIITLLDGHALAVGLAGAWLHKHRGRTAGDLLARLRARSVFPDLKLDAGDKNLNLELALRLSYDELDADSQRHFRALGVTAQAGLTAAALGALWGIEDQFAVEDAVTVLSDAGLLDEALDAEADESRYDQHPLLRAYAAALLTAAGERDATFLRYAQYFTEQAEQFDTRPPETWRETIERDLAHILEVGDALVVRANAADVQVNVIAVALAFAYNTTNFVFSRMEHQRREWLEMGLTLSRAAGDSRKEALFLNQLGLLWITLGENHKSLQYFEQALPINRAVGNRAAEATTLNNIGEVYQGLGEPGKALGYYEQALPIKRAVGNRGGEAATLNNIGTVHLGLGEPGKALGYYEQALPLHRAVGDRGGEATTLNSIGAVYQRLGEPGKALDYFEQALLMYRAVGDRGGEATSLNNMAGVYFRAGDLARAAEILRQIIEVARAIGAVAIEAGITANLAATLERMGERTAAIEALEQAIVILKRVGLPYDAGGGSVAQYEAILAQWRGAGRDD